MPKPHGMLYNYSVDEAIETLPIAPDKRKEVVTHLMRLAPHAYAGPEVSLTPLWKDLPTDVQNALNDAATKEYAFLEEV